MVHGLDTLQRMNEQASESKQPKFALVSTVDSMGSGFPSHCVMLFNTEEEATKAACDIIVEYCDEAEFEFDPDGDTWFLDAEGYSDPAEFLAAFQEGLDSTEYFHVKPIKAV